MSTEDRLFQSLESDFAHLIERKVIELRTQCESEIEVMYGVAANILMTLGHPNLFKLIPASEESEYGETQILLMPQYPWQNYRIDWVWRWRMHSKHGLVFIECDGHDFHERTKEQAEHDRSKDRVIQAAGIPILRFTGREIFRDVVACVFETVDFISARLNEALDG